MDSASYMLQLAALLALSGVAALGVLAWGAALAWFAWLRLAAYLKNNPEASRLLAEHVIVPLLAGGTAAAKPEVKRTKGTLV